MSISSTLASKLLLSLVPPNAPFFRLKMDDFVIKEIEGMTEYELPDYLLGKIWKGKYRGQRQKWFVIRFLGHDQDINLNTSKPEFIEWKWTNIDDLPSIIVDFKKKLYMNLVPKIKLIIG